MVRMRTSKPQPFMKRVNQFLPVDITDALARLAKQDKKVNASEHTRRALRTYLKRKGVLASNA